MMNAFTFKLEMAAVVGTGVLIAKMMPKLSSAPGYLKWIHFGLVGLFSLIGIAGPRFALMFCLRHERFVELFSQPNILGVGPTTMQCLALLFAVGGTVFFVAVMMLGEFRKKARTVFTALVFPCSILHPIVMLSAFGVVSVIPYAVTIAYSVAFVLALLGGLAVLFYRSEAVARMVEFR